MSNSFCLIVSEIYQDYDCIFYEWYIEGKDFCTSTFKFYCKQNQKDAFETMIENWEQNGFFDTVSDPVKLIEMNEHKSDDKSSYGFFYCRKREGSQFIISDNQKSPFGSLRFTLNVNDEQEFLSNLRNCSNQIKSELSEIH